MFRLYDKNMDGDITPKEAGNAWNAVKRYDQDGNGRVDRADYDAYIQAMVAGRGAGRAAGRAGGGFAPRITTGHAAYDKNEDGVLVQLELGSLWQVMKSGDANKDGKIDSTEYAAFFARSQRPGRDAF